MERLGRPDDEAEDEGVGLVDGDSETMGMAVGDLRSVGERDGEEGSGDGDIVGENDGDSDGADGERSFTKEVYILVEGVYLLRDLRTGEDGGDDVLVFSSSL